MSVSVELTDAEAAAEAGRGDADAFMVLVNRYRTPLIGHIYGLTGSRDEAEELAQDVFCRAWQRIPTLRQPGHVGGWLYRIAHNTAVSAMRRRRPETLANDPPAQPSTEYCADHLLAVHRAVAALPEHYRIVVSLRYFAGFSDQAIADQLGISPTTVRTRLWRAYGHLRKYLVEMLEE